MRILIFFTTVFLFPQFLFAQTTECPNFKTATGYYDGESLWWREDDADRAFQGQCMFQFNEATRTFSLQTTVPMCYFGFEIVQAPSPELCPFQPYQWNWQSAPNQVHALTVQFPATIQPCLPSSGQTNELYHFKFRVYYKIPLYETKNPKT